MKCVQDVVFDYLLKERGCFYILDEIKFNHFLGSKINKELYLDIIGLTGATKDTRLSTFKATYNIQYFGELLERYEERGIVKSDEDFRALVLATFVNIENSKLTDVQINTTQLTDFIKKVEKFAKSKQDIFCLNLLTLIADFTLVAGVKKCESLAVNMDEVYDLSIKNLETNEELSFEERIFSIYSLNNYLLEKIKSLKTLDEDKYDKDINKLIEKREKLLSLLRETRVKPLKFKRDYYIYLLLIDMIESNESLTKAKEFKNKEILNQFKKLLTLGKKEYNKESAKDLSEIFDMDENTILFYNYVCARGYDSYLMKTSKVSSKGMLRLSQSLLDFLERDEVCDEFILENMEKEINYIAETNIPGQSNKYRKDTKGINVALIEFFKDFDGKISLANMDFVHKKINVDDLDDKNNLYACENFEYIVTDGYINYLYDLGNFKVAYVLESFMLNSKNFDCIKKSYELWQNLGNLNRYSPTNYENMFKRLFEKGVIDINSLERFKSVAKYEGFLKYLLDNKDYKRLYDEANMFVNDLDGMEKTILGYVGGDSECFFTRFLKGISKIILNTDICKHFSDEDDLEFIKEFYILQDNLKSLCFSKLDYALHVFKRLGNEHYLKVFNISDDEVKELLKELSTLMKNNDVTGYQAGNILRQIDELVLSDFEKEELRKAKIEEYERISLERLEETDYYYDFVSSMNKNKESESFAYKVKSVYFDKIKSDKECVDLNKKCFSSANSLFTVARALQNNGVTLSDEELLEISKACLELA